MLLVVRIQNAVDLIYSRPENVSDIFLSYESEFLQFFVLLLLFIVYIGQEKRSYGSHPGESLTIGYHLL